MSAGLVTAITPRILLSECERRGVNVNRLIDDVGLPRVLLQRPSGQIPVEKMHVLWERILYLTRDQMFALRAAEGVPFGEYRLLDYLMAVGASPQQALQFSTRAFSLVNSAFLLSLVWRGDFACLELYNPGNREYLPRPYVEYIFANYLVRLRSVTRTNLNPVEVRVTYRKPERTSEYERLFRAPVRFNSPVNSMLFPREMMKMPLPSADPELFELLESHANRKLQVLGQDFTMLYNTRRILQESLRYKKIDMAYVARQLAMSPRSLQRSLLGNGTTFREVLDAVRREQALRFLDELDLSVREIAARLGFGTVSSFSHACHRWTGLSPHSYRKHIHRRHPILIGA